MSSKVIRDSVVLRDPIRVVGGVGCDAGAQDADQTLKGARAQAQQLLEQAQTDAAALLAQGQVEAEVLKRQAQADGQALGMQTARQETAEHVARIAALAQSARDDCAAVLAQLERALPELALAVARKIVGAELTQNPDAIVAVVRQAVATLRDQTAVRVRVASGDMPALSAVWQDLWSAEGGATPALIADPSLERGGCVIDTRLGALDGRLATRFVEIGRAFGLGLEDEAPELTNA